MFCGKCGNQIPEGVAFCPNCGNAMGSAQPQPQTQTQTQEQPAAIPEYYTQQQYDAQHQPYGYDNSQNVTDPYGSYTPAPKKKISKNTVIGIAAVAVVAVALIVALFLIIGGLGKGGSSPEAAAEAFIKAFANLDADKTLDCIPDKILEVIAEDDYDGSLKELKKDLREEFEEMKGDGWDIKVKVKVKENEKVSRDELKKLKEKYEDDYDVKITEARDITVKLTVKGEVDDEDINETVERNLHVIKVGKKWYIDVTQAALF